MLTDQEKEMYRNATINNIRRGKGARDHILYAHIVAADGTLLMAATLDMCANTLKERFPGGKPVIEEHYTDDKIKFLLNVEFTPSEVHHCNINVIRRARELSGGRLGLIEARNLIGSMETPVWVYSE